MWQSVGGADVYTADLSSMKCIDNELDRGKSAVSPEQTMTTATIPGAITRNQLIDQLVNGKLTAMYEDATAVHVTRDNMRELQQIVMELQAANEELEAQLAAVRAAAMNEAQRLQEHNARLQHSVEYWQKAADHRAERMADYDRENTKLIERAKLLEARLLPFAREYNNIRQMREAASEYTNKTMPTKHFRAAAEALELAP